LNYSQKDDLEYLHNELNDLLNNVTTDEVEGGNEICDSISGVVSTCVYELGSTSTDYQTVLPTKDFAEIIEEFIEFVNSNNLDN
jgi:hypothetical protein